MADPYELQKREVYTFGGPDGGDGGNGGSIIVRATDVSTLADFRNKHFYS